jgi:O-antigen ligase
VYLRLLSALTVLIVVAVFLLPSTIAIYTAVNGTAWDLLDVPWGELLVPALVATFALALLISVLLPLLTPEVTHPVSGHARLFELDCALIC